MTLMTYAAGVMAADPPSPINLAAVTDFLRAVWFVVLIFAGFALFTAARKGKLGEVLIGFGLLGLLSMMVFAPETMRSIGTTLSKFIS